MGYVLDTCFLIDLVRGHEAAVQKATEIEDTRASKFLCTPVLFEMMTGLLYRRSNTEANRFRRAVSSLIVLPFDEHAARTAAEIQAELMRLGRRSADADIMIAGIAAHHGHILITRDENLANIELGIGLDVEGY